MDDYVALGKRWLAGEDITSFGDIVLNEKQALFVNAKERFVLVSGGFASGKTTGFIIKLWLLSMFFPGNRILLGRKTRQDVERATLPDIIDIFPAGTYEHKVGPGKIVFPNGSEIIFFGLDSLQSGSGDDIKKAQQQIKSLNLGGFFIDQLEEIDFKVFEALDGRLRRNVPFRQSNSTTNPANFWALDYFKTNPRPNTRLIETSMLDNKDHLPEDYIASQLTKGEMYVRRYVYGEWDQSILTEGAVFSSDIQKDQKFHIKPPIREMAGMKIFVEPQNHEYQIGIDPSLGAVDPSAIAVVDKVTGELVATFTGFVPTSVISAKAVILADMYSKVRQPLIVPEATGAGQALVEDLKKQYDRIYERQVFSKRESKILDKLGFFTNFATKVQLIENMTKLFHSKFPKIRDGQTLKEMETFIYTDEAQKKGAGAQNNYHDDRVMAMMLAYWDLKPVSNKERHILDDRQEKDRPIKYQYV